MASIQIYFELANFFPYREGDEASAQRAETRGPKGRSLRPEWPIAVVEFDNTAFLLKSHITEHSISMKILLLKIKSPTMK